MRTVLITGSNRGIGAALRRAFEQRGDRVIGCSREEHGDLRVPGTILRLKDCAEKNGLDILVNNAGIYSEKRFMKEEPRMLKDIMETDLLVPMLLTRALYPLLKQRNGTVVFVNSVAGREPAAGETAYRAAKFGLTGFSNALAREGIKDGIRVLDVPFGGVNTDMLSHRAPLTHGWQQPDQAAQLILSLLDASDPRLVKHNLMGNCSVIDTRVLILEEEERIRKRKEEQRKQRELVRQQRQQQRLQEDERKRRQELKRKRRGKIVGRNV